MMDGPISLTAAAASQRRREASIRSRELMRGFFQALAAGNPQPALAAHDQFCERLIRQYRSNPGSNDLAQSRLKATGDLDD
jgi:hypothetical protein